VRLGISGPTGGGKSTLLARCTGALAPAAGMVSVGASVVFAAIDPRGGALDDGLTVLQEVAGPNAYVRLGDRLRHVEGFLDQFLFPGAHKHALVGTLSGGERNRVLLARMLCAGGNVLVLDEPTNDLDLMTLRALEEALAAFAGCVLVVSHDRWFLDRVATRVVHLDGLGRVTQHAGGLDGRLGDHALRRDGRGDGPAPRASPRPRDRAARAGNAGDTRTGAPTPRPRRLAPWEERECESLPDRIGSLEAELAALDARLASPELYRGPVEERRSVTERRSRLAAQVAELTRRWEELESRR
jgi:ATP-binding cassette subfamily F protein uup